MSECLEVRYRRARAWLESVRACAAMIESTTRELRALQDAKLDVCPGRPRGHGSGGAAQTHSDPTAREAEARITQLEVAMAETQARLDECQDSVGRCLEVLERMRYDLTPRHAKAIGLYYVDLAPTWSEVADEMGCSRTSLWDIRCDAYEWIERNCRNIPYSRT